MASPIVTSKREPSLETAVLKILEPGSLIQALGEKDLSADEISALKALAAKYEQKGSLSPAHSLESLWLLGLNNTLSCKYAAESLSSSIISTAMIGPLTELLTHNADANTREYAALALGWIKDSELAELTLRTHGLADSNSAVRLASVDALLKIGKEDARREIARMFTEEMNTNNSDILKLLVKYSKTPFARGLLEANLANGLKGRKAAQFDAGFEGTTNPTVLKLIREALLTEAKEDLNSSRALKRTKDPDTLEYLYKHGLKSGSADLRHRAVCTLKETTDSKCIMELISIAESDSSMWTRQSAMEALSLEKSTEWVAALVRIGKTDCESNKNEAINWLASHGLNADGKKIKAPKQRKSGFVHVATIRVPRWHWDSSLLSAAEQSDSHELADMLTQQTGDPEKRLAAVGNLSLTKDPYCLLALAKTVCIGSEKISSQAAGILLGTTDKGAIRYLMLEGTKGHNYYNRVGVAQVLGSVADHDVKRHLLKLALEDESCSVRKTAWKEIAGLYPYDDVTVSAMRQAINSEQERDVLKTLFESMGRAVENATERQVQVSFNRPISREA